MNRRTLGWVMVLPTVLLLLAIGVFPLVYAVRTAVHFFSPNPVVPPEFYGLGNLFDLLRDRQFMAALRTTGIVMLAAVSIQLGLGTVLAVALNRIERGRGLVVSLLLVPSATAPIVAGIVWWMLFNTRFGAINAVLHWFGVPPLEWTVEMPYALVTIVVAAVWQWTPFVAVILLGGLTTIPATVIEAASIDGAHGLGLWRHVLMPLLRPFFAIAGLLMIIEASRLYELPYYITQGGPGNETVVLGIYLFKVAFQFFDLGRASMLSLLYVAGLNVVSAMYLAIVRRGMGPEASMAAPGA